VILLTRFQVPVWWCWTGLAVSTISCTAILASVFGLPFWQPLIATPLSFVLAYIAVRTSGETDTNPVGSVAKVTQLVFALIAPGHMTSNLMAAAISGAGAAQAGDMMGDFKTGLLLKQSPKYQFIAQIIGIVIGVVSAMPIYKLFISTSAPTSILIHLLGIARSNSWLLSRNMFCVVSYLSFFTTAVTL
jgi:uncharacterized oligopeptide transporter (OPT) family protein